MSPQPKLSKKYAGRLGGLKGGIARRNKLSSEERRVIAQKAARARWSNKSQAQNVAPEKKGATKD
jgi:hypothetical protein